MKMKKKYTKNEDNLVNAVYQEAEDHLNDYQMFFYSNTVSKDSEFLEESNLDRNLRNFQMAVFFNQRQFIVK